MSEKQDGQGSNFPFTPPPASHAPISQLSVAKVPTKKGFSSKKQLKRAKKNKKSAISVRSLFTGLILLSIVASAVTAVISPGMLTKIVSGDFIAKSETCKVTELNSSMFFDTSCGKFEWNKEKQPERPSTKLRVGKTYKFDSVGIRIEPAQVFPYVETYKEVKLPKKGKR